MLIFELFHLKNEAQEAIQDPKGYGIKRAKSAIILALLPSIIAVVLVLGILFIVGFTSFLGGPSVVGKFFFFLFSFIIFFPLMLTFLFYRLIKKSITSKKDSGVVHVDAVIVDNDQQYDR